MLDKNHLYLAQEEKKAVFDFITTEILSEYFPFVSEHFGIQGISLFYIYMPITDISSRQELSKGRYLEELLRK